ncbi:MAG: glycosyltransferase family A protein [Myxococcota bacterium]
MSGAHRISVIIPAKDAERYLGAAIASIVAQAPSDGAAVAEIIVVDDGSSDATAAVARAASPLVHVVTQPASGIGAARNAGVRASDGDWLAFLDADDLWEPDKLALQVTALAAAPDSIVLGQVEEFTSPELGDAEKARLLPKPGRLPGWLAGAMLLARSTFEAVGPFDAGLAVGETIAWFAAARARATPTVVLDALVLRRRLHGANYTLTQREVRAADYVALAKQMLDRKRRGGA